MSPFQHCSNSAARLQHYWRPSGIHTIKTCFIKMLILSYQTLTTNSGPNIAGGRPTPHTGAHTLHKVNDRFKCVIHTWRNAIMILNVNNDSQWHSATNHQWSFDLPFKCNLWGEMKEDWSLLVIYLVHLSYWRSLAKAREELGNDKLKGELSHCCSPPVFWLCQLLPGSSASLTGVS